MPSTQCTVCGTRNSADALFCSQCTSPISVVALGELTDADRAICMGALASILAESPAGDERPVSAEDAELFEAYLSAVWLRPETALIQYAEARGLRHLRNMGIIAGQRWMDLGCGDGVHAALYSGWRFGPLFDVFQSLDLAARDLFDHFDPREFSVDVARRGTPVNLGIDIKKTAVERSRALGVFGRVEQANATRLSADDGSVDVIFSNMLRDLGKTLPAALAEVRRVLAPGGTLVVSAMTPAYQISLYFAPAAQEAERRGDRAAATAMLRLDRGRSVFCKQQLTPEQWRERFADAGLELTHAEPIVGAEAIRFWDVGLRPFSVPMVAQAQRWREAGILGQVKPALLSIARFALESLRRRIDAGETCMHLLVARRR